jgi:predicted secreted protein
MAVITGKDGSVSVDTTNVSLITSWSITIEADTLEFTSFDSAGWKQNKGSLLSWNGSLEGFADTAQTATVNVGDTVDIVLVEGGTGSKTYTGEAVVTSKNVEASTAELVTVTFDVTGTGELVESTTA